MIKSLNKNLSDFPILQQKINGERLAYLDNAATTQVPQPILDKMQNFYQTKNANVHRGVYTLAQEATEAYEQARQKVQHFIHAAHSDEIIFTHGTTESLNLVVHSYGEQYLQDGDEILISLMEHHSNLVPWQQLALKKGVKLNYINLTTDNELDLDDLQQKITNKTKVVALCHVSNVLGVINPIQQIAQWAHQKGAILVVDGAQAVPHFSVNVQKLDVDFYAFSGHKMLGPTGIGVLYGKQDLLDRLKPWQYGGEMINQVGLYQSNWTDLPSRLEAGTPNIIGALGLGWAIDYLRQIGMSQITKYEQKLLDYLLLQLKSIPGITIYSHQKRELRSGIVTFNLQGIHPHDVATALDQNGVEVRAGYHCAQPLMQTLGINASVRVSIYLYNTLEDIKQLLTALQETREFFTYESK